MGVVAGGRSGERELRGCGSRKWFATDSVMNVLVARSQPGRWLLLLLALEKRVLTSPWRQPHVSWPGQ